MAAVQQLSAAFPLGSSLSEAGVLQIAGCDARELAREFGTPCYVVAEDDLRARARAFLSAFRARAERFDVLFATKAFPCTARLRVLREEGLGCAVASGGALTLAPAAGLAAARLGLPGDAKTEAEPRVAGEARVRHVVLDNLDGLDRLQRITAAQPVMLRVTPGVRGRTHDKISTGQADSKFGFSLEDANTALDRVEVA